MKPSEFILLARQQISSDPMSRLSAVTQEVLDRNNYIFDTHCHFFDVKTVNIKYLLLRFLKDKLGLRDDQVMVPSNDPNVHYLATSYDQLHERDILNKGADTDEDWQQLLAEIDYVDEQQIQASKGTNKNTRGIFDIIDNRSLLLKDNVTEVYEYYLSKYAINQYNHPHLKDKELIVTLLMMDLESGWEVKVRKNMRKQMQEIRDLCRKYPVLPYFPVDPRRTHVAGIFNLYELFLEAFRPGEESFFGVKVYPGLGYLPSDYRLLPIFEICQEKNIPIITHCGGEAVTTHEPDLKAFRLDDPVTISGESRQKVAAELNHPKEWLPVLEKFPNLKINLAHCGGGSAWAAYGKNGYNDKVETIIQMTRDYPNVYADFSFNVINSSLFNTYKAVISAYGNMRERALFGSDYWVVCGTGNLKKKQSQFFSQLSQFIPELVLENPKKYLFDKA
ncbi:MAG: amidohydrolase family protein [Bacteroidota bacterium]